jgi:hypothetical protein
MGAAPSAGKRKGISLDVVCIKSYTVLGTTTDNNRPLNIREGKEYHVSSELG